MKSTRILAIAVLIASGLALYMAHAQQSGASISSGMISASPGVTAPKHWHPGEEIIYVLEGSLEY